MAKGLKDVFKDIKLSKELEESFSGSKVNEIELNEKSIVLNVELIIKDIISPKIIEDLQNAIKEYVNLPYLEVEIREVYDLENKLTNKQLFMMYKSCLIYYLNKDYPYAASRISVIEPEFDGGILKYSLNELDYNYFENNNIANIISNIIGEKFKIDFPVMINLDVNSIDMSLASKKIMQINEEYDKKIIADRKINQKKETTDDDYTYGIPVKKISYTKINNLVGSMKNVQIIGEIVSFTTFDVQSSGHVLKINVTDYKSAISCTAYVKSEQIKEVLSKLKEGKKIIVHGYIGYDNYAKEDIIKIKYFKVFEKEKFKDLIDHEEEKRVELHLHTRMSDMSGICSPKDAVSAALSMGHRGVAITDNAVVQGFIDANKAVPKDSDFKVIFGCEINLADDLKPIVKNSKGEALSTSFVVFDLETTGFYPSKDNITEIGATKIVDSQIVDAFSTFVNPKMLIPKEVTDITGITDEMVVDAPTIEEVLPKFLDFIGDSVLVAHNSDFDMSFLLRNASKMNVEIENTVLDTLELARVFYTDMKNYKLGTLAKHFKVPLVNAHRAVDDAAATARIFLAMLHDMNKNGITTTDDINKVARDTIRASKKIRPTRATILVKNLTGLRNLYELVSLSHIDHFYRQPKVPKSLLMKLREGLIVMSGCAGGELYSLLINGRDRDLKKAAEFYDYIEIEADANNMDLVVSGILPGTEELRNINRKLVKVADELGKKAVATSNVYFLHEEERIIRDILLSGKNFPDEEKSGDYYFRNTSQMLDLFSYLGKEKAREIVVTNTNYVFDEIEKIAPVPSGKYPPVIEGSDKSLKEICYKKAHKMYGEKLPEVVQARLDKELNSIISNGFAVMYIIAYELVKKSEEDGYLVGSRGSVGSSFVATMAGITEVNPLPPHYYCEHCGYSEFDNELVREGIVASGFELPKKNCPSCGVQLKRDGQDIPFETFLGFNGNKEPDIDLNFSGEYQAHAHKYTEELFGKGNIFRAGTISTVAEKTAIAMVKDFFNDKVEYINRAKMNYYAKKIEGTRRTTGQHPGGLVVVPKSESIYKFTPIQKPANKMSTDIITTHFDYHSIDENLLKLDILGHDDPTMLRILQNMTGVNPKNIDFDNEAVLSLFESADALEIKEEYKGDFELGSLGIPELGTDFVMGILKATKPKCFSDLVRISGLSHGEQVWRNNAQELVRSGVATIKDIISTRDDIMTYLIEHGVEKHLSFSIMEKVRKGKGLDPDMEKAMIKQKIPKWYIDSCKKIKYMFPKAHAVAYIMMAFRIAYYKIYHKKEYYSAYFSIRASSFDHEIMTKGYKYLKVNIDRIKEKEEDEKLTAKEKDLLKDIKMVEEMYVRGVEFAPIDINTVDATRFQVVGDKIMPSLTSISGLGENVAKLFVEERDKEPFISLEDLKQRTKLNTKTIEYLEENNILVGLPKENQLSLFDY